MQRTRKSKAHATANAEQVTPTKERCELDRSAAMARHGGVGDRGLAGCFVFRDPARVGLLGVLGQKCTLDRLGIFHPGMGAGGTSGWLGHHEHSETEEKRCCVRFNKSEAAHGRHLFRDTFAGHVIVRLVTHFKKLKDRCVAHQSYKKLQRAFKSANSEGEVPDKHACSPAYEVSSALPPRFRSS